MLYTKFMGIHAFTKLQKVAGALLLISFASSLGSAPATAAYSRPVTWSDMSAIDLRPAFRSQYSSPGNLLDPSIPDSAMMLVLKDADARISQEFHVPEVLKPVVAFWLRIYAEYTTQHVVIYDSNHPELVYEVLDFRSLAATARNAIVYEIVSKKKVADTLAAYRQAFVHLARVPKPKKPTPQELNILTALKKLPHKHRYLELKDSLRSQLGQRDNIIKGLLAAETFFPNMERLFTKMNVPLELTRLTLVESSFNLSAVSKVGASGVWQFMPKSAKEYMTLDDQYELDERRSPLKATVAAAKLLKRSRKILGNWALAVTSFNHGVRNLPRLSDGETDFSHVAHLFDSCSKKTKTKHLGYASRNYYAEFLAVLHAEAYRNLFYGQAPIAPIQPVAFRLVLGKKNAIQIAMDHGVSLQEFQLYNPDVMNVRKKLPKGFWVAIPGENEDLAGLTMKPPRQRVTRNI